MIIAAIAAITVGTLFITVFISAVQEALQGHPSTMLTIIACVAALAITVVNNTVIEE